jgi:serine phosphatase RsbU (regulator of sigma subunit)
MNLRIRLIAAFFLLSVVPLAAVTFYGYANNAAALRDAAGREAEVLAGDLTERMKVVTAQLSQQFERLVDPAESRPAQSSVASSPTSSAQSAPAAGSAPISDAERAAADAARVAAQLGEVAMLLNNIEVRDFGRDRRGRGGRDAFNAPDGPRAAGPRVGADGPAGSFADGRQGRGRPGAPPAAPDALSSVPSPPPPALASSSPPPGDPSSDARGRGPLPQRDGQEFGRGGVEPGGDRFGRPDDAAAVDPNRIQIDLGAMRRELMQQLLPDRERWDQLSQEERGLLVAKVNERILGIQQGIQIVQQKATEQAAGARTAAASSPQATRSGEPPATSAAASSGASAPGAPPQETASGAGQPLPTGVSSSRTRETAFSGSRMDVRVLQGGRMVGQINAEINLPNLLATVFTTTRREQGEVPFAVDASGRIYTPTEADRIRITSLHTSAVKPQTLPGTELMSDWVVATTADPTGSGLRFGIARPLGAALDELRRSSARNAALGLGLIALALAGIVPLSFRLTRNLTRLSDAAHRIAKGDYGARVNVRSNDEIGRLADAFNGMAADVERHQHAAVEQERLRRELELGRQIQHDMLPQAPLRLGLTEVRGVSVPATEVGGDFFNYFQTPDGRMALVVGDVSGKGVGAALLMANIQASLRTRFSLGQELTSLARELDSDISASTPDAVYATLFVALLDPVTRVLDYVNAGHNPQFVLRSSGGLERMHSTGLPIGLLPGRGYGQRRVDLASGDVLFFYTDGCVEAENPAGEMFGATRLEELIISRPASAADDLLAGVERALAEFRSGREPFDDATMMVVHVG